MAESETSEDIVIWNSQPIRRFSVGPYRFNDGVLKLPREESEAFEKILEGMPLTERMKIAKIDMAEAQKIAKEIIPAATKVNDSSAGRAALQLMQAKVPKFGIESVNTPKEGEAADKA